MIPGDVGSMDNAPGFPGTPWLASNGSSYSHEYAATPVPYDEEDLAKVAYNSDGLVPAIVQEVTTGEVLMLAWMDETALKRTLESGRTWFWSRSRQEYWCKGETSGDRQWVREVSYDCDGDALLILVVQEGKGACHTGERTCFYRSFRLVGASQRGRSDGQLSMQTASTSEEPSNAPSE
jgi:phosphoribosyl-AMP cyclohydrolase